MRAPIGAAPSIYLVVEDDPFVAIDLTEALGDLRRGAEVHLAGTAAQAMEMMARLPILRTVVIGVPVGEAEASGLVSEVRRRGGRIVLIDNDDRSPGPGTDWVVLSKPFSTQMFRDSLDKAEEPRPV